MASQKLMSAIMKHLSGGGMETWSSTVAKVTEETGYGSLFVEDAMKTLVENGHVRRASKGGTPSYVPAGHIDGKYSDYNQKRLEGETPKDYWKEGAWKIPVNPKVST